MLVDRAGELERCKTTDEVWSKALAILRDAGLPFVIYIMTDDARENFELRTNIPQLYSATDPARDPFLDYCCKSYEATRTGIAYLPGYDYLPKSARRFIEGAEKVGFRSGFGIPMRLAGSPRYGGFNVGTPLDREAFEDGFADKLADIQAFCLLLHRRLEELGSGQESKLQQLSPREREILTIICNGASRKEAAQALGLSPNTVAEYSKSAYRKLNVKNRAQAARAIFGS